jgi:putative transposase
MHTRKIVGWSMCETLHIQIALDALNMAIKRQRPARPDPSLRPGKRRRGYRLALAHAGVTPSMSRKGDCWDNAPMESFLGM